MLGRSRFTFPQCVLGRFERASDGEFGRSPRTDYADGGRRAHDVALLADTGERSAARKIGIREPDSDPELR